MKPRDDEMRFRQAIAERVRNGEHAWAREIAAELGLNTKRAYYLCLKWSDKGWWEYGVNALAGWLTESGMVAFGLTDGKTPNANDQVRPDDA